MNDDECQLFFVMLTLFNEWYSINKFSNNLILLLLPTVNNVVDEKALSYWLKKYTEPYSMIRSGIIRESYIINNQKLNEFSYIGINYIGDNGRVCNMDLITALTHFESVECSTDVTVRNTYSSRYEVLSESLKRQLIPLFTCVGTGPQRITLKYINYYIVMELIHLH